jgi:hypothetical protein
MGKSAVESKTIWGAILTAIPVLSSACEQLIGSGFLPPAAVPIVGLAGITLTILGRLAAKEPVTSVLPK